MIHLHIWFHGDAYPSTIKVKFGNCEAVIVAIMQIENIRCVEIYRIDDSKCTS